MSDIDPLAAVTEPVAGPAPAPELSSTDPTSPPLVDPATIGAPTEPAQIANIKTRLGYMRLVAQTNAQSGNPQMQMEGFSSLTLLDALDFLLEKAGA